MNPKDTLSIVQEWHNAFDVPVVDAPSIPEDRAQMRLAILEEEVTELRAAVSRNRQLCCLTCKSALIFRKGSQIKRNYQREYEMAAAC